MIDLTSDEPVSAFNNERWMKDAACAKLPPAVADAIFFPDYDTAPRRLAQKRYCNRCPVQAECLDYAVRLGLEFGTFGGVGAKGRQRMRRDEPAA